MNLPQIFIVSVGIAEKVFKVKGQRSKVKGQDQNHTVCYNSDICVPPTVNYIQYLATVSTLAAAVPFGDPAFSLTGHTVWNSPGLDQECRVFQTFA